MAVVSSVRHNSVLAARITCIASSHGLGHLQSLRVYSTQAEADSESPSESTAAASSSRARPKASKAPNVLGSAKQLATMLRYNVHFQTGDEYSSQTVAAIERRAKNAVKFALAKQHLESHKQGGLQAQTKGSSSLQSAMQQHLVKLQQLHDL